MTFTGKDLISITDLSADEILSLCRCAAGFRKREEAGERYAVSLQRKTRMAALFYEPSTRTNQSFKTAVTELGGNYEGFTGAESTSVMKKETIRDTIKMFEANHFDVLVMRHPNDGSVQWAADVSSIPVLNGGDGKNEHPTQSLLDLFTIYELNRGKLDGLSIGFGGDLSHGRTVRSLCLALSLFKDVTIRWAAEDFLGMPEDLVRFIDRRGVKVVREQKVEDVLSHVDIYYMTRPQLERMEGATQADVERLIARYRIDLVKLQGFKGRLLHPLPVNSEVAEIEYGAYFSPSQSFFRQAENGVLIRKALLHEMLKETEYRKFSDRLSPSLQKGNNKLIRLSGSTGKKLFVDRIEEGLAIDHLRPGSELEIAETLRLGERGHDVVPANLRRKGTSFLKTDLSGLTERELKQIAMLSPDPTVNVIRRGMVAEKFVYLLCRNSNCITWIVNEDVPCTFYRDDGKVHCRYCRHELRLRNPNVTEAERRAFVEGLPEGVEAVGPVLQPKQLRLESPVGVR